MPMYYCEHRDRDLNHVDQRIKLAELKFYYPIFPLTWHFMYRNSVVGAACLGFLINTII